MKISETVSKREKQAFLKWPWHVKGMNWGYLTKRLYVREVTLRDRYNIIINFESLQIINNLTASNYTKWKQMKNDSQFCCVDMMQRHFMVFCESLVFR